MTIIKRIYDRMTGVLGRDCQGKAVRKGDLVEPAPHIPIESFALGARCQMTVDRRPNKADLEACGKPVVLICINPDGKGVLVMRWEAIRKVPQCELEARWENVERMTGWTPRIAKRDEEVPA